MWNDSFWIWNSWVQWTQAICIWMQCQPACTCIYLSSWFAEHNRTQKDKDEKAHRAKLHLILNSCERCCFCGDSPLLEQFHMQLLICLFRWSSCCTDYLDNFLMILSLSSGIKYLAFSSRCDNRQLARSMVSLFVAYKYICCMKNFFNPE